MWAFLNVTPTDDRFQPYLRLQRKVEKGGLHGSLFVLFVLSPQTVFLVSTMARSLLPIEIWEKSSVFLFVGEFSCSFRSKKLV